MSPLRAALDRALQRRGTDVILRRVVGAFGTFKGHNIDAPCRARIRGYRPDELVGNIQQTDMHVILSPTGIYQSGWPGGLTETTAIDDRLPKNGDFIIWLGRLRRIVFADHTEMDNEIVRIELRIAGGQ